MKYCKAHLDIWKMRYINIYFIIIIYYYITIYFKGIVKCLRQKTWMDERPYEVKGTNDASVDAPKRARINAVKQVCQLKGKPVVSCAVGLDPPVAANN